MITFFSALANGKSWKENRHLDLSSISLSQFKTEVDALLFERCTLIPGGSRTAAWIMLPPESHIYLLTLDIVRKINYLIIHKEEIETIVRWPFTTSTDYFSSMPKKEGHRCTPYITTLGPCYTLRHLLYQHPNSDLRLLFAYAL